MARQQQAQLTISLDATQAALQDGLIHSEAAVGPLQAAQAGHQLWGTQIGQLQTTNTVLRTMAYGQSIRDMHEAAAPDQALMRAEAAMADWGMTTPTEELQSLPTSWR